MLAQNLKIRKMRKLIKEFTQLVKIIERGVRRRKPFPTPRLSSSKAKLGQLDNIKYHWLILLQIIMMSVIGYCRMPGLLFQRNK